MNIPVVITTIATPEGLRIRAQIVREAERANVLLNDSGSCANHLEAAAALIEAQSLALKTAYNDGIEAAAQIFDVDGSYHRAASIRRLKK